MPIRRYAGCFLLVAVATCVAFLSLGKPLLGVDDANIFLVYARNLLHGEGFVYSPEGQAVEGVSSLAWTAAYLLALALHDPPEPLLFALNVLLASLSLTSLLCFVDDSFEPGLTTSKRFASATGIVLLIWVFSSPGYICWTTVSLMEAGLWSALLIWGTLAALAGDRAGRFALVLLLLLLTRPEGMFWGAALLGIALLESRGASNGGFGAALRSIAVPLVVYVIGLASLTAARFWYFGFPLPNPYYAKVSPDLLYGVNEGARYALRFFKSNPLAVLAAATAAVALLAHFDVIVRPESSPRGPAGDLARRSALASLAVLFGVCLPILEGGDHFGSFRFYQPIWPLIVLPGLLLARWLGVHIDASREGAAFRRLKGAGVFAATVLLALTGTPSWWHLRETSKIEHEFRIAEEGRAMGNLLNQAFPQAKPSIGVGAAGGIAVTYEGRVVDLLGINDLKMGHSQGNRKGLHGHAAFSKSVFFELHPDLVLPQRGTDPHQFLPPDPLLKLGFKDIFEDEEFVRVYRPAILESRGASGDQELLFAWWRRGFFDAASKAGQPVRTLE